MANVRHRLTDRTDLLLAVGLCLLTIATRLPFRSQVLYHWDSANFAFAMRRFDVAAEQPQPPGYIAYVWLCRLVDLFFGDAQSTMVAIAIVGSGLSAAAMYLLGRAMYGRRVGLVGAVLLASSPLFWFYGEIALPHTFDLFLITFAAWLLYVASQGRGPYLLAAAVTLAVAGGVRQQTPVFMGLTVLVAALGYVARVGWVRGLPWGGLSAVVGGALCAGWFFPLMASVGGIDRYREIMGAFSTRFHTTTSLFKGAGWFGLTRNLRKLGMYTLYAWGGAVLPFVGWLALYLRRGLSRLAWFKASFLVSWVLPSFYFYAIIHMGQQGLVFVYLPVLLLLSAVGLVRLSERRPRSLIVAAVVLVTINVSVFCLSPEYPLGKGSFKILSWDTLRNNDAYFSERFRAIRAQFSSRTTVIVASRWRHVQWYLPEYKLLPFTLVSKWELGAGSAQDTGGQTRLLSIDDLGLELDAQGRAAIVLFDGDLDRFNDSATETQYVALPEGKGSLGYLSLHTGDVLRYGAEGLAVLHP